MSTPTEEPKTTASFGNRPAGSDQPLRKADTGNAPSGFDANRPTVISLLYLLSALVGVTSLIGIVLAYVWRGDAESEPWMESHFTYHIRTFWIGLLGSIIGAVLTIVLIGFLILMAVFVWFVVRSVIAFMRAQKREPMPDPETWLI